MLMSSRRTNTEGFTFIELVIAITILGVLAVTVGPPLLRYITGAKEAKTKTTLKSLKLAIDEFRMDTNRYPSRLKDLVTKPQEEDVARKWRGPYIEGVGFDVDSWGHKFVYRVSQPGAKPPYELYSHGTEEGPGSPKEKRISVWDF